MLIYVRSMICSCCDLTEVAVTGILCPARQPGRSALKLRAEYEPEDQAAFIFSIAAPISKLPIAETLKSCETKNRFANSCETENCETLRNSNLRNLANLAKHT